MLIEHFGPDDLPRRDEFAKLEYKRDQLGRVIMKKYFGPNGEPTTASHGAHEYRYTYDSTGRLLERTCFDEHGQKATEEVTLYNSGRSEVINVHKATRKYAANVWKYDSVDFYGLDGQLLTNYSIDYGDKRVRFEDV